MRFLNNKVTKLVALGIVLGVIFSYLLIQLPWFPPADSTQADRTDRLTYGDHLRLGRDLRPRDDRDRVLSLEVPASGPR